MSIHNTFGYPALGLTKGADVPHPFRKPIDLFDDFLSGGSVDFSKTATGRYLIGGVNSVATSAALVASQGTPGGYVRLTTAGASADSVGLCNFSAPVFIGQVPTDPAPFSVHFRANLPSVAACTYLFGFGPQNGVDPFTTQSQTGAYIVVTDGVVGYQYKTSATTVATTAATWADNGAAATLTAGYHTFRLSWDGASTLTYYVNGRLIKIVVPPAFTSAMVTVSCAVGATTAAAKTLDVDYWGMYQQVVAAGR